MKKFMLLIVAMVQFTFTLLAQSEWQLITSPVSENFTSVCFTDAIHGWIVSDAGSILLTTDGGSTWETINFPAYHFKSVHFSDNNHGCAVGLEELIADSSLIMVTNDGGSNWSVIDHYRFNRLNDVFFINNDIGWAVGAQDALEMNIQYYTDDGGLTWDYQNSILMVGAELLSVHFRDENLGSTCGADGAFFVTNNGGTSSWAMGIAMPLVNLNAIYNFGMLNGCIVGDGGTALYTINNWYQFIDQNTNTTENLNGVSGDPTTSKLWAVGDNGTIIYSPNYLLGWTFQNSGITENLNDVCMLSETEGWAVGNNGTILHFTPATGIDATGDQLGTLIFPNPAKDHLSINFGKGKSFNHLMIYSQEGQCLLTMNLQKADEQIMLNLSQFSSGIYLLYLIGDLETKHQRFILQ